MAKLVSSRDKEVSETLSIDVSEYRAFLIVVCDGEESDPTIINTYTFLSGMINKYYRIDMYDPIDSTYIGNVEIQANSFFVHLNALPGYFLDVYGLIKL